MIDACTPLYYVLLMKSGSWKQEFITFRSIHLASRRNLSVIPIYLFTYLLTCLTANESLLIYFGTVSPGINGKQINSNFI